MTKSWNGCLDGLYPDCLECPLPECRYEGIVKKDIERNKRIVELVEGGMTHREAARQFGLSRQTVGDIWRKAKSEVRLGKLMG